jgi:hypothetical protein
VTHRIILARGLEGGGEAVPSPGASGMINAQPESLNLPSIVTNSPLILPTTFIKFDWDITSSLSGKTAYLSSAPVAKRVSKDVRLGDIGNGKYSRCSPILLRPRFIIE